MSRTAMAFGLLALLGIYSAPAESCGIGDRCLTITPTPIEQAPPDQQVSVAMQREINGMHSVMVLMLLVQQETLNTLREMQAAQAQGAKP